MLDLALKSGHFPKDLLAIFENEGVWRENMTANKGGYIPIDQVSLSRVEALNHFSHKIDRFMNSGTIFQ